MTKGCPVDVLQYEWEFDFVLDLYKRVRPKVILEIGTLYGGTIYQWLKNGEWNATVIGIDLFANMDYQETKSLWQSWEAADQEIIAIKGNSCESAVMYELVDVLLKRNLIGIDWILIDGDHSKGGVSADFNRYWPLLNDGGFCIVHDIVGEAGVSEWWNEFKKSDIGANLPRVEITHPKHPLGIGIIQKWELEK